MLLRGALRGTGGKFGRIVGGSARSIQSSSSLRRGRSDKNRISNPMRQQVRLKAKNAAVEKTEATIANGFAYSDTVILMDTNFNQRANAIVREPELQEFWEKEKIYESLREAAAMKGAATYVLHDGPPYANGELHIGHALNKILKDFINRYQMIQGKYVEYVPGWDCHGLPIELKVLQSMKSKERQGLTPVDLRKKAAAFAKETVDKQMTSFQRYGVWANWKAPYLTLQPEYEAAQIEVFGKMFLKGHIYRGRKPVHWSPSSRTALAEAELEYPEGHTSQSIYVAFDAETVSPCLEPYGPEGLRIAIWTTTPWTIPANLAVAVNSRLDYSVVEVPASAGGGRLLVATDLVASLSTKIGLADGEELSVLATFKGSEITSDTTYRHPLAGRISKVVEGGDYITTESGTGLVHTAPGHGQEDYQTGLKYDLPLLSPVDDAGRFTEEAGDAFVGKDVLGDGNSAVIEALKESGNLLSVDPYLHKYPYDWRTKKPTIFRATDQWFASVDNFRDDAMAAIDSVTWMPDFGKNRISAMTSSRADWCISRQRTWGVPIPVFYHRETGEALMTEETISHVVSLVREKGSDAWFELDEADLLPPTLAGEAEQWQKGTDTMDVWFDSGSSWSGVINARNDLSFPADLYLEGSDQHRGWFQSSLLTSVASEGVAPYKQVLTHGFVLDEKGTKMSKSIGNVVDPLQVIEGGNNKKKNPAYGADVLRLWVASVDYTSDVCIGDNIIKQVSEYKSRANFRVVVFIYSYHSFFLNSQVFESYRRIRNTARYLIGNLADFNPSQHTVSYDDLSSLDKYILGRFSAVVDEVTDAFENFQFFRASQALLRFASADLSSFYLDIAKDRLYISDKDAARRRSCQTVFATIIEGMAKMMSPMLPHMAEDIWVNLPYKPGSGTKSVFQDGWVTKSFPEYREDDWACVLKLRNDVNKAIEVARTAKLVGSSLDCAVTVHAPLEATRLLLEELIANESGNEVDDLRFLTLTSKVELCDSETNAIEGCGDCVVLADGSESGCTIGVKKAGGQKCERCWMYSEDVGSAGYLSICPRCAGAVTSWEQRNGH